MLRLAAILLLLVFSPPALSQESGGPHGNIDQMDSASSGHALDQREPVAEETAPADGECVWDNGFADIVSYFACRSGLHDIFRNVQRALAVLALLLVLSALLTWFYLKRAANAARLAASYIPTAERAYVFGGPTDLVLSPYQATVRLAMQNYGKTPALLSEWLVEFWGKEPRGTRPAYDESKRVLTDEILEPNRLFMPANVFKSEMPAPFYVVGYIKYADVFEHVHVTRFCVAVAPDGKAIAAGPPAWSARD